MEIVQNRSIALRTVLHGYALFFASNEDEPTIEPVIELIIEPSSHNDRPNVCV